MSDSEFFDVSKDEILPFKLNRKDALEFYKEFKHGKIFAPSIFRNKEHIAEIKPVYLPYWVLDGKVSCDAEFNGTKVRTYGEQINNESFEVTETQHIEIVRKGNLEFSDAVVPATDYIPAEHFERMEPFDFSLSLASDVDNLLDVESELGGQPKLLDSDKPAEQAMRDAEAVVAKTADEEIRKTVTGFNELDEGQVKCDTDFSGAKRVFAPAWMLETEWGGRTWQYVMNGQTGKVAAELPVGKGKIAASLIILFLATLIFVAVSDAVNWHIVGIPAKIIMYVVLPCFVAGALTLSYHNQIQMVNRPKPPTPNKPATSLELDESVETVVNTDKESKKKRTFLGS